MLRAAPQRARGAALARVGGGLPTDAPLVGRAPVKQALSAGQTQRRWLAASAGASPFENVPKGPLDPILGLSEKHAADPSPSKVNLGE